MQEENRNLEKFIEQSVAINQVVIDILNDKKNEYRRQWLFMLIMCVTMLVGFVAFAYTENKTKHELMVQLENTRIDFMEYLDNLEYVIETETTTTTNTETTQTVEGDSAEINNVQGNQYKDEAVHNEG